MNGISRMQEAMKKANFPELEFHTDEMFTAVFKRTVYNATTGGVNGGVNLAISNEVRKRIAKIANFE